MKIKILFLAVLVHAITIAQDSKLPDAVLKNVEDRVEHGYNKGIVIGVIDEQGTHYYGFGEKSEGGEKPDEHTLFEIGSVTKLFTATLLADQIIKGKMHAEDPVGKFLPTGVLVPSFEDMQMTLGQLSDHTSGLPRLPTNLTPKDPANPYIDYTTERLYEFLSSYTLPRPPGAEFEYSNLGVGLLGQCLALHHKSSYEEMIRKNILSPLKLKETTITLTPEMKSNLALPYNKGVNVSMWDFSSLAGAGAIRSNAYDLLKFITASMGNKKNKLTNAFELAQQPRHQKLNGSSLGLGWIITPSKEGDIFWHSGGTGGYSSFVGFVKETGKGVVILTNSTYGVDELGMALLNPGTPLSEIKPDMAKILQQELEAKGPAGLKSIFISLLEFDPDKYLVDEASINALGYYYLNKKQYEEARALFEINVHAFPNSFNVYDSYGEVLMLQGETDSAIVHYKKSLELNPGNVNGIEKLKEMGVDYQVQDYKVSEPILLSYTGVYELAPGFNIEITLENGQLYGQATGQPRFELFPKSDTEFYLTVVDAQIHFKTDAADVVSLTLYQGGQVIPGRRL